MSRKQESLRDLIESRAAWHIIAPRTLCRWALDAIAQNVLHPEGVSLDTEFSHGGMPLTWRKIITAALDQIDRVDPSDFDWFRSLTCDPTVFDKWLDTKLQAVRPPEPSRFPLKKRTSDAAVLRVVRRYVEEEQKSGRHASITRMWNYVKKNFRQATRDQAIKALRAIEGGPKERGRPRK
jgi:hypothetical protein